MARPIQLLQVMVCVFTAALLAEGSPAAEWKPEKPVEFVVPAPAGGALDGPARVVQKIWQELKLVDVPVNVLNRSGGGQAVGATYVQQAANDPHRLLLISGPLISNHIWKKILANAQWVDEYVGSAEMRKHLDQEYAERRKILTDLGLAK